ncbi:uncharacterized protein LOC135167037 [Diachasmimorpha longicaudata]|uniref:uncharacterized protein LOC135167037 n=1 Tax=Diachasmimorpha longicaudata TaxID=58733 RepID=UPI0030B8B776
MADRAAAQRGRRPVDPRPRKTRCQLLREAKNVAVVLPEAKPTTPAPRQSLAKTAPKPRPPRRVAFDKPKATKGMLARQAAAQAKILEANRKQAALEAATARRRPIPRGRPAGRRPPAARQEQAHAAAAEVLEESRHLARAGNAEVIQAVPVGDGDIGAIIIPPGVISEEQTTIVEIVPPEDLDHEGPVRRGEGNLNHSIEIIRENLSNQDAAEAAAVQEKLDEFQQARRDFIMELASVTVPGIDPDLEILDVDRLPLEEFEQNILPSPRRRLHRIPDDDDEVFHLKYGRNHPAIIAAREFRERKEQEKRIDERFLRAAEEEAFDLDAPLYEQIMDADISFEEDEEGMAMPCKSRVKAPMPRSKARKGLARDAMFYPHSTIKDDVEELERFFNIDKYPPIPKCGPPPGRQHLNPDLWELDDPWYREPTQPDVPDLIEFSN